VNRRRERKAESMGAQSNEQRAKSIAPGAKGREEKGKAIEVYRKVLVRRA